MLKYEINDNLKQEFNKGLWLVDSLSMNKNNNLMMELRNTQNDLRMKVQVQEPLISSGEVQIEGAKVKHLIVKDYRTVYGKKYFELLEMDIENGGKNAKIARSS